MARICELTGKKTVAGKSRRHQRGSAGGVSGRWSKKAQATNRTFRPNLIRNVKLVSPEGKVERVTIAASTLKRIKNFGHYQGYKLSM
jgi:ribosomal protein L28